MITSQIIIETITSSTLCMGIGSPGESESEVIYLVIFQTQETSAKTKSGRCRRGHLEKIKSIHVYKIIVINQQIS